MGTTCNCAPFVVDFFCYERDFMMCFSDDNQADVIEVFSSTSRYLDDFLYIDNPYFEQMVGQIYPTCDIRDDSLLDGDLLMVNTFRIFFVLREYVLMIVTSITDTIFDC